jgi:hypothetical protein
MDLDDPGPSRIEPSLSWAAISTQLAEPELGRQPA